MCDLKMRSFLALAAAFASGFLARHLAGWSAPAAAAPPAAATVGRVFAPSAERPINHAGADGAPSPVLKRVVVPERAGIPGLVHLSLVDFRESLSFPTHAHGEGFHEVFLALSGRGEMTLDGVSTGPLSAGDAVHVPPGVEHRGRALPSDGESFRMAYFALLDSPS